MFVGYLYHNRVFLILLCDIENSGRHCCGKKYSLSFFRNIFKDIFYILTKPHIKHFIGFVKNYYFQCLQFKGSSLHMVHNSSRSADNDIRTSFKFPYLSVHACTAVNSHRLHPRHILREFFDFIASLHCKFSRRAKYKHLHTFFVLYNALNCRYSESCGFSCSRIGTAYYVMTFFQNRNTFFLYFGHFRKSHVLYCL